MGKQRLLFRAVCVFKHFAVLFCFVRHHNFRNYNIAEQHGTTSDAADIELIKFLNS